MHRIGKLIAAFAGLALCTVAGASAASATEITWNFGGSCASGYACNSTAHTFLGSDGSTLVTAKAWGRTEIGYANDQFADAYLGHYSNGLGVTNDEESGSYPNHAVDNSGRYDIVSFFFSETVDVVSALLIEYGDTDISFWIGNAEIMPDLTGATVTDLDNLYGAHVDNHGGYSDRTALFDTGSNDTEGNFLIIGAKIDTEYQNDYFKIKALAASDVLTPVPDTGSIPEPGSMTVFGLGVLGFIAMRRRNARNGADDARALSIRALSIRALFARLKGLAARAGNAFALASVSDDRLLLASAR